MRSASNTKSRCRVPDDARPHDYGDARRLRALPSPPPSPARPRAPPAPTPERCSSRCAVARRCAYRGTWCSPGRRPTSPTCVSMRARTGRLPVPEVAFKATIQRTPDGPFRLSVTLVNQTPQPDSDRGFLPEVAIYDAGFGVTISRCPRRAQRVPGHRARLPQRSAGPCARPVLLPGRGRLRRAPASCAPPRCRYTGRWSTNPGPNCSRPSPSLAADPVPVLERIEEHMAAFAAAWDNYLATVSLAGSRPARLRS